MLEKEFVKKNIEDLIEDYDKLRHKAMENDHVMKVYQFTGSIVSLRILLDRLGLSDEECDEEDL